MLHIIIFFIFCLFFCPKEWMQNFTQNNSLCPGKLDFLSAQNNSLCPGKLDFLSAQNNSLCPGKLDFLSAQNNSLCPINQSHIECHSYRNENTKSEVCVKKADKSQIRSGFLIADAYPYGKKKSSGKNRGGYGYIPPSVLIADGFFVNSNGDKDIEYSIFNNLIGIHVVYLFFDCSGNHSWIGFFMNSLEVCNPKFRGDFYFPRDEIHEGFTRNRFIELAQITDKIRKYNLPFN